MKPVLLAFLAAVIWGLWWIPIRYLETLGLGGALGGMAMNAGAFAACAAAMVLRRRPVRLQSGALLGAALVGVAAMTYSVALNYGGVVRVVLLFYLAPAWSKIIEWKFMHMPWRWTSSLALVSAFAGAFLILGSEISGAPIGAGDILAIFSGIAWAAGAALIFAGGRSDPMSLTLATSFCAVLAGLPFVWVAGIGILPQPAILPVTAGMGLGVAYVLPILLLTLWSAQRLAPAMLSFLLTAEILSGVISGVLLLDEPFGYLRMAGAVLIIFGALGEVLPGLRIAERERRA